MAVGDIKEVLMEERLGQPNGVAALDANGKLVQMPDAADVGAMAIDGYITSGVNVDTLQDGFYAYNGWISDEIVCTAGLPFVNAVGLWLKKTAPNDTGSDTRTDVVFNRNNGDCYVMGGYSGSWHQLATTDYVAQNAAPAGYGLGNDHNRVVKNAAELDSLIYGTGWFFITADTPFMLGNVTISDGYGMVVINGVYRTQFIWLANGVQGVRHYTNETGAWAWGAVEWVNPPMSLGVECRTTERYMGKPVYVKLNEGISLPANGIKNIAILSSECRVIEVRGFNEDTGAYFPSDIFNGVSGQSVRVGTFIESDGPLRLRIETNFDGSAYATNYVLTKFYKTTD